LQSEVQLMAVVGQAVCVCLTALIPRPRADLTRFHGVFAPNNKYRALVTPSTRGKNAKRQTEQSPF
ncbi:MAG: hypothetical protein KJP04_06390, partial [Arenicella sp.]|nr:hypothetical protein [Arenicella sp.]